MKTNNPKKQESWQIQWKQTRLVTNSQRKRAEFEAFQEQKKKKAEQKKSHKLLRNVQKQMVDEDTGKLHFRGTAGHQRSSIKASKQTVMDNFKTILEMKEGARPFNFQ